MVAVYSSSHKKAAQSSGSPEFRSKASVVRLVWGGYPVVTLEMARRSALEARRVAKEGGDPIAERRRNQNVPTFREACYKVLEIRKAGWSNPQARPTIHQHA